MIKLKDLLTEEETSLEKHKEIVDTLKKAEKVILKAIPKSDQLSDGKIKWVSKGRKLPGHIELKKYVDRHKNVFKLELKVEVSKEAVATIYAYGYVSKIGSNKGEVLYKANVLYDAKGGEAFKNERDLLRWIEKEIKNFKFPKKIVFDLPTGQRSN